VASNVEGHTPPWTIPIHIYTASSPSILALGQSNTVIFWIDITPPTLGPNIGYLWQNITIDITKPDSHVEHFGPLTANYGSSGSVVYTPDKDGQYNVTLTFPEQVLTTGTNTGSTSAYINDSYAAATAETTFTVQETVPDTSFHNSPLPVSYWERPIDSNDENWYVLASNWLGQNLPGATYLKFQPNGLAPNTAHTILTIPLNWGGLVGGVPANIGATYYQGEAGGKTKFNNPLILNGILYYSLPLSNAPSGAGVTAVNLRTGETLWTNPNLNTLSFGQLYDFESSNEHGVEAGYLWTTGTAVGTGITNPGSAAVTALTSSYAPGTVDLAQTPAVTNSAQFVNATNSWIAIDPVTGRTLFNETNVPTGIQAQGPNGEWLIYGIGRASSSSPYTYLWQWNNTKLPGTDRLNAFVVWTPGTTNWNMSAAYDWNVTLSESLSGTTNQFGSYDPTILRVIPGDVIFGQSSGLQQSATTSSGAFGSPDPYTLWAINLNASRGEIGNVLWQKTYLAPANNLTALIGPIDSDNDVFTVYYRETLQWSGYSLLTGNQLWGPTEPESSLNYYGGVSSHLYPYAVAYDTLYSTGFSGTVYAYDLKTGKTLFTYGNNPNDPNNSTASIDAPYGNFGLAVGAVADHKVYLITGDYDPQSPPYKGASTIAIDASTGQQIWKVYGTSEWEEQAVADGYYVWFNQNEQTIYVTGPGPSTTTISAPDSRATAGNSLEIKGTVTDQSPALKDTPAISDADQGAWTNYLVEHTAAQPNATGVSVFLTIKNQDGTPVQETTVTSDSNGLFHYAWIAPTSGEYTVTADFQGTQSYGPSSAETAFAVTSVDPAPTALPLKAADYTPTYLGIIIAALVALAGAIAAIAVLLRKHK
jgi:hypothetical protein